MQSISLPPEPLAPVAARAALVATAGGISALVLAELGRVDAAAGMGSASVLLTLITTVLGVRARNRRQRVDRLIEALHMMLGARLPSRRLVEARRWRGQIPTRVRMSYAAAINDSDPDWLGDIVAIASRRLEADYAVRKHDKVRGHIHLTPAAELQPLERVEHEAARAARLVGGLIGPTAEVSTVIEGEVLKVVDVRHDAGVRVADPAVRRRIEQRTSVLLPGRWRARWELESDAVRFELRPTLPTCVVHPRPVITTEDLYRIPLAVDEDGQQITWNLKGSGPHLMVVGKTGTGKTVVILGATLEFAARGWPVFVIDPKRVGLLGLRAHPNVQLVATRVEDQVATVYHVHRMMEERYERIEAGEIDEDDLEPVLLVLDEYRDFYATVTAWYAGVKQRGMPTRCDVFEKVGSLARKGRGAKIFVVLGTQRPDSEFLGGEMRDNFDSRISLGRLSPEGSRMMWEDNYRLGLTVPRRVEGRAIALNEDGWPVEVQSFWTPDPRRLAKGPVSPEQNLEILNHLRADEAQHGHLQVQLRVEMLDGDDGGAGMWAAVTNALLVPADVDGHLPGETSAPRMPAAEPVPHGLTESSDADSEPPANAPPDDEYEDPEPTRPAAVEPGDLLLVDESTEFWAVIEGIEEDIDEPDCFCIDWRSDDDESGSLTIPADSTVMARRARDTDEGEYA